MKTRTSISIKDVFYILLIVSMTFPIVVQIPILGRPWIFASLGVIIGLYSLYKKHFVKCQAFIWLVIYEIIVVVNFLWGDAYFNSPFKVLFEFIYLFLPVTLFRYFSDKISSFIILLICFFLFFIECTIVSAIAETVFPGIIRLLSNEESINEYQSIVTSFQNLGMSNYLLPHAVPVLIPAIVYNIKKSVWKYRIWFIIALISALVLVYVSNATTAILLSIIMLFSSVLIRSRKGGNSMLLLLIVLLPILLSPTLQLKIVNGISYVTEENDLLGSKLQEIEESIEYGDGQGDVAKRNDLYEQSINAFLGSALVGTNEKSYGGHSAILDRLATLGIFGVIPFYIYLMLVFRDTKKMMPDSAKQYYYLGIIAVIVLLFMKNMSYWPTWCATFFLLPNMLLLNKHNKIEK